jgi:hypothetical protein
METEAQYYWKCLNFRRDVYESITQLSPSVPMVVSAVWMMVTGFLSQEFHTKRKYFLKFCRFCKDRSVPGFERDPESNGWDYEIFRDTYLQVGEIARTYYQFLFTSKN